MFVFPAFNESYSKRKRTYKCCRKCRSRRVRCVIKDSNYDVTGCVNCKSSGIICDLIVKGNEESTEKDLHNEPNTPAETSPSIKKQKISNESPSNDNEVNSIDSQHGNVKQELEGNMDVMEMGSEDMRSESIQPDARLVRVPPEFPNQLPLLQHHMSIPGQVPGHHGHPGQIPGHPGQIPGHHGQVPVPIPGHGLYQVPVHIMANPNHTFPYPPSNNGSQGAGHQPFVAGYPMVPNEYGRMYPMAPANKPVNYGAHNSNSMSPSMPHGNPANYMYNQRPDNVPPAYHKAQNNALHGGKNALRTPQTELGTSPSCPSSGNLHGSLPKDFMVKTEPILLEEEEPELITAEYLKDTYNFVIQGPATSTVINIPTKEDQSKVLLTRRLQSQGGYIRNKATYKYLKEIHAFTLHDPEFNISAKDVVELLRIYFREVNDIFLAVDEDIFWTKYNDNSACSILLYAMILVTVRHQKAYPIISKVIGEDNFYEKLENVIYNLEKKIRQILLILPELGDEDKGYRCKVYCLLSLNFGPHKYGNEQSSQDLHAAIGLAMSILIHMDLIHQKLIANGMKSRLEFYKKLWWTLYIIDRFNGVINTKAFMIKKEDFSIGKTDDEKFNGLIKAVENLEEVIFLIYQPQTSNSFDKIKECIGNTNKEIVEGSVKLRKSNDTNIKFDYFTQGVNTFTMIVLNNVRLRAQGKFHEFDNSHLSCCQGLIGIVELAASRQVLLQVPIVASLVSLGLSIILKYRIKIIYLYKLNKLQSRPDLNGQKIELVHLLFDRYCYNLERYFKGWWFINEILASIEKLNKNTHNPNLKSNKQDKNKINIKSLLSKDDSLPSIVTISSPSFYQTGVIGSEFLKETENELISRGLEPDLSQLNKPAAETVPTPPTEEFVDKSGSSHTHAQNMAAGESSNKLNLGAKDQVESKFSTPTTSVSDGIQNELFDLPGELLQVENNRLLEYLNDELFNNRNLAEFVTEDPNLQDFFSSLD